MQLSENQGIHSFPNLPIEGIQGYPRLLLLKDFNLQSISASLKAGFCFERWPEAIYKFQEAIYKIAEAIYKSQKLFTNPRNDL